MTGTSTAEPSTTRVVANAKLTLALRVTGVRDDGYHLIDAEMVSLALADTLTLAPDGNGITCDGAFAEGTPLDGNNLVARALQLCERTAGVHIHKAIPHGGGLGGGSSDAAAVLRWAGYYDVIGAAAIGADVPFCLLGGRARVRGIGELVEPISFEPMTITLVIPPLAVSTPAVYRAWDELGGPHSDANAEFVNDRFVNDRFVNDRFVNDRFVNDLEAAAIAVEPRLAVWRDRIKEAAGERPTLAGSGATWFLRGHHHIADALPGARLIHTQTVPAEA